MIGRIGALAAAVALGSAISPPGANAAGLPQLDAGAYHTCGLKVDGTTVCWGDNTYGQSNPPAGTFTSVSSGYYHSCGVRSDTSVACWGWNALGQSSPAAGSFKSVSAGYAHSCGVRTDDTLACWGYHYGSFPPPGTFTQVAAGNDFSCGVRSNGSLACWGYNHSDGNSLLHPSDTFSSVSVGLWHSCAVRIDGVVDCWGLNGAGQSGTPVGTFSSATAGGNLSCGVRTDASLACWGSSPTAPAGSFESVTAGYTHACAVRTDGTVVCWGGTAPPPEGAFPPLDTTPPAIAVLLSGTLGENGWYTSDVAFGWSITEPSSPGSLATSGCVDRSITADQAATVYACSASSLGGSSGPVEVTIKRDATAPSLACGSPMPIFPLGQAGAFVTASVTDATSGPAAGSVSAAAATTTVGLKTASLTASDNAGNQSTTACAYRVGYSFGGFSQPVDNGLLNVAKAGKAIPLKWRLTNAAGNPFTNLPEASISTVTLACGDLTEGADAIEEYTAGSSGLQNHGDGYYQLNWKSPSTYAGTCKRLRLDLGEGVFRTADFRFTK